MATIITKNSQTASAVPSAASLAVGELAVNTADGKLYTEHTGGVVKEIIPSTVVDGGITANKLASNAVTTAKIADSNVTGAKLENSGVTAGSYGTSSAIPAITVDAKGRVTSVTTNAVASAPTTAQVLSATAGASVGAIGTYAILSSYSSSGRSPGYTHSGFDGYSAYANDGGNAGSCAQTWGGGSPSGTWRLMGNHTAASGLFQYASLWLRIS
jgi:hypothetical protein